MRRYASDLLFGIKMANNPEGDHVQMIGIRPKWAGFINEKFSKYGEDRFK
jgi:hypothetical protein